MVSKRFQSIVEAPRCRRAIDYSAACGLGFTILQVSKKSLLLLSTMMLFTESSLLLADLSIVSRLMMPARAHDHIET